MTSAIGNAEFATLPAETIVASLLSWIPAVGATSASTTSALVRLPLASRWAIPRPRAANCILPDALIRRRASEFVVSVKVPPDADRPADVPVNNKAGEPAVPVGNASVPVMASPDLLTLLFNCACTPEVVPDR